MQKVSAVKAVVAAACVLAVNVSFASDRGQNAIYVGVGAAQTGNRLESDQRPLSLGYLRLSNTSDLVIGFDISGEGTMLDSTWGQNQAVSQATSYNLLVGRNLMRDGNSRVDVALVLGMRESFSECPASYLGYQCYANTAPNTRYALNYGAVLSWSYRSVLLGVRATGESVQALVGLRF